MNTNDFRSLEYIRMHWEICEDYHVLDKGQMQLPAIRPYETYDLPIPTDLPAQTPGATYYVNLHLYLPLLSDLLQLAKSHLLYEYLPHQPGHLVHQYVLLYHNGNRHNQYQSNHYSILNNTPEILH